MNRDPRIPPVAWLTPARHEDPGAVFVPRPVARPANPRLTAPVGQVRLVVPEAAYLEVRYRLAGDEWTAWRPLSAGVTSFPLRAIAWEARQVGAVSHETGTAAPQSSDAT